MRIGSTIPKYHVATVEMKMDKKTQADHDALYCPLIFHMEQRGRSGDGSSTKLSDSLQDNVLPLGRICQEVKKIDANWDL